MRYLIIMTILAFPLMVNICPIYAFENADANTAMVSGESWSDGDAMNSGSAAAFDVDQPYDSSNETNEIAADNQEGADGSQASAEGEAQTYDIALDDTSQTADNSAEGESAQKIVESDTYSLDELLGDSGPARVIDVAHYDNQGQPIQPVRTVLERHADGSVKKEQLVFNNVPNQGMVTYIKTYDMGGGLIEAVKTEVNGGSMTVSYYYPTGVGAASLDRPSEIITYTAVNGLWMNSTKAVYHYMVGQPPSVIYFDWINNAWHMRGSLV